MALSSTPAEKKIKLLEAHPKPKEVFQYLFPDGAKPCPTDESQYFVRCPNQQCSHRSGGTRGKVTIQSKDSAYGNFISHSVTCYGSAAIYLKVNEARGMSPGKKQKLLNEMVGGTATSSLVQLQRWRRCGATLIAS